MRSPRERRDRSCPRPPEYSVCPTTTIATDHLTSSSLANILPNISKSVLTPKFRLLDYSRAPRTCDLRSSEFQGGIVGRLFATT
ncbi:hypothetical protein IF2G_02614 [Cordyceps javanica]|nr:hypothetical protein IF2G_02614 [Cordyceps javanica]